MRSALLIGTRPEAIKLLPVYQELCAQNIATTLICTGQHQELMQQVLQAFAITPDITLQLMQPNQSLAQLTSRALDQLYALFVQQQLRCVIVQGDTTSAMVAALAAFYCKIPVVHVEAGLRTGDMYNPYPEEVNRQLISRIATVHCAPTQEAVDNLLREGITPEAIALTGNTVVDALYWMRQRLRHQAIAVDVGIQEHIAAAQEANKKIILLTVHRRESFGEALNNILQACRTMALQRSDLLILFPYHPNPHVIAAIEQSGIRTSPNVILVPAVDYPTIVFCLLHATVVVTDSGGLVEEAVSLGKPVCIVREKTERPEAVAAGYAVLAGTTTMHIIATVTTMLTATHCYQPSTLYGDGQASKKIVYAIAQLSQ